jgi:hypothetical protein
MAKTVEAISTVNNELPCGKELAGEPYFCILLGANLDGASVLITAAWPLCISTGAMAYVETNA